MRLETSVYLFASLRFFIACANFFLILSDAFLECLEISEDELEIDDLYVTFWIDGSVDVMDIGVIKITNHLKDGIDISYVREEFIPKPLSFTCSFDEAGDIDELDRCGYDFCTIHDGSDLFETSIIDIHDANIWLDRTKWKIGCFCSI